MFSNIDHFYMFTPDLVHNICEFLYDVLKILLTIDVISIKSVDQLNDFSNKINFFFAIFDNHLFSNLDILCKNWNFHYKRSMIWW